MSRPPRDAEASSASSWRQIRELAEIASDDKDAQRNDGRDQRAILVSLDIRPPFPSTSARLKFANLTPPRLTVP